MTYWWTEYRGGGNYHWYAKEIHNHKEGEMIMGVSYIYMYMYVPSDGGLDASMHTITRKGKLSWVCYLHTLTIDTSIYMYIHRTIMRRGNHHGCVYIYVYLWMDECVWLHPFNANGLVQEFVWHNQNAIWVHFSLHTLSSPSGIATVWSVLIYVHTYIRTYSSVDCVHSVLGVYVSTWPSLPGASPKHIVCSAMECLCSL